MPLPERAKQKKRAAFATLVAVIFLFATGPSAEAERRGIVVTVVKNDRSRTQGELVAVRRDSVVLHEDSGHITFIDVGDIKYIEKPRQSALIGAIRGVIKYGSIGGVMGDLASATNAYKDTLGSGTFLGGAVGALFGGIVGGIQGAPTNAIETIWIQGFPPEIIKSALLELSRDARIRDWT